MNINERKNAIDRIRALGESGYSLIEISKILGIPESTVRSIVNNNEK